MAVKEAAFSEEASVNASRADSRSESSSDVSEAVEPVAAKPEGPRPEAKVTAKPAVEAAPKAAEADDDATDEAPMPKDLAGYETALKAARGDARKNRKQWRAVELERQAVERKLAAMEGELRGLRSQPSGAQPQVAPKPEGPKQEDLESEFYANPVAFMQKLTKAQIPDVDQAVTKARLGVSEFYARKAHPDFDEKTAPFLEAAKQNPVLRQQILDAPDPGEFLYEQGKLYLEAQEIGGDPNAWRERERAKIKAELEAALGAPPAPVVQPTRTQPVRPPIPPKSNAGARGSGSIGTRSWTGPRSTEQVWGEGPTR